MEKYYIQFFSPHGLIRYREPEIGRDSDTGGQIKYLLELLNALSKHEQIDKVDLFTRQIKDIRVSPSYTKPIEKINEKARIVRISCGGKTYRKKEQLWNYLDEFVENTIRFLNQEGITPDIIHGHYADGNYIARELHGYYKSLFIATGHSLGRTKKEMLLNHGHTVKEIESEFNLEQRVLAEENALMDSDAVIASTNNEVKTHYKLYKSFDRANFKVIPPGTNTEIFYPFYRPTLPGNEMTIEQERTLFQINNEIERFLYKPDKALILAIARPDKRKGFETLIQAYGSDPELQTLANLAIFAGIRKDIVKMPEDEQEVLTNLLLLMDKYDLYGKLAIPKKNDPKLEIPEIYRIAARKRGVFINATPNENFGLTLIEAGASGLPVVADTGGGPREIIEKCKNGIMTDVRSPKKIAQALKNILSNSEKWNDFSSNGIQNVNDHFSWEAHANEYLRLIKNLQELKIKKRGKSKRSRKIANLLMPNQNVLISDIDGTLIPENHTKGISEFKNWHATNKDSFVFGVATGRNKQLTKEVLKKHDIPYPAIIICSAGSEIYYTDNFIPDKGFTQYISHHWDRGHLKDELASVPKIHLQSDEGQREFKLSYYVSDDFNEDDLANIHFLLDQKNLKATILFTQNKFLDFLPFRASKGSAVKFLSKKWNIPIKQFITAGDSGNDKDMLRGMTKAIVVGNYSKELEELRNGKSIYFSDKEFALGVIEGVQHYSE